MGKFAAFLLIGGVLTVLGITNIKGNISSIHWYNRRKVSERDISQIWKVCRVRNSGNGGFYDSFCTFLK